jgi:uncharacterized membrane protein
MTSIAATRPVLVFVTLLSASVWVGGFVAIAVVARIARSRLDPAARVSFFRALGRRYGIVSGSALVVMLVGGALLLTDHAWDATAACAVAVAAALVLATVAGVAQARGMTRLRRRALDEPDDRALAARVRRGAGRAAALRATIGALSLVLLALASVLAT